MKDSLFIFSNFNFQISNIGFNCRYFNIVGIFIKSKQFQGLFIVLQRFGIFFQILIRNPLLDSVVANIDQFQFGRLLTLQTYICLIIDDGCFVLLALHENVALCVDSVKILFLMHIVIINELLLFSQQDMVILFVTDVAEFAIFEMDLVALGIFNHFLNLENIQRVEQKLAFTRIHTELLDTYVPIIVRLFTRLVQYTDYKQNRVYFGQKFSGYLFVWGSGHKPQSLNITALNFHQILKVSFTHHPPSEQCDVFLRLLLKHSFNSSMEMHEWQSDVGQLDRVIAGSEHIVQDFVIKTLFGVPFEHLFQFEFTFVRIYKAFDFRQFIVVSSIQIIHQTTKIRFSSLGVFDFQKAVKNVSELIKL